jgi:limonene-1,2-epoxide hydrolase
MSDVDSTILAMWQALSKRDWESVKSFLSDDCIYLDVPTGPTLAARGPEDIVKRIKLGLEDLADYVNHDGVLLTDGVDAMYEHSETWTWKSGETALLKYVSVHKVEGGKITLWKDYWDYGSLTSQAPSNWIENLMSGDMSWIFDATGLV